MQTPLTPKQQALYHTQCPHCKEDELSALDSIMPDAPFLWCPNCDTTIDGDGTVEADDSHIMRRLEYLRAEIQAERISTGEILELQSLAQYIEPSDVELLEWAGVPEFKD